MKINKQTVKSSRAWAPRLSFLASAECMVMHAFISKFSSSIVSIKSEFLHVNKNMERVITMRRVMVF